MSTTRPPVFDDRYTAPAEASRRGAHRARPNPLLGVLPLVAGAAVVAIVAIGVWTLLGDRTPSSTGSGTVAAAPTQQAPTTPSAASPTTVAPTSAGPTVSSSASTAPSGSATAGGQVDKTIAVRVRNATGVRGLAATVATKLTAAGWTASKDFTVPPTRPAVTRVYYGSSAHRATAEAVVADLGFGKISRSSVIAGSGITVVLGHDATTA